MDVPHDVFLSHAGEDHELAQAICDHLERRNLRCWMAPRDIIAGTDYGKAIVDAIKSAKMMVVILSEHSNDSRHVRNEVERAFNNGVPIVTFRTKNIAPTDSLEYFLSAAHWLDAIEGPVEGYFPALAANSLALLKTGREDPPAISHAGNRRVLRVLAKGHFTFRDTKADVFWDGKVVGSGSFRKGFDVTISDVTKGPHKLKVKFHSFAFGDPELTVNPEAMSSDTIELMHSGATGNFSWRSAAATDKR